MLTYSFQNIGKDSLYEYLYKCIRQDILEGRIAAGEKLPSKRSFAKNLGISVITVENAYAQLMAEGYIYSVPKSGYYAAKINQYLLTPSVYRRTMNPESVAGCGGTGRRTAGESMSKDMPKSISRSMSRSISKSMPKSILTKNMSIGNATKGIESEGCQEAETAVGNAAAETPKESSPAAGGADVLNYPVKVDLVSSRTDPGQFPFTIWARLLREVLSEKRGPLMTSAPGAGIPELRRAIARYLLQYQGMQVTEEQIIVGAGTEYLYGLIIQLLGQEKTYALEDPGYVKVDKIYQSHLVKTAHIPMDKQGIRIDALRSSNADVMHISPSHHFPTGVTTSIGRRYELLGWANEKEGRYIIEDDYDCEFRLAGRPIPSLQSIDQLGRVIYMNTFTKSLTPTIRISYMVLPQELLVRFREKLGFYSCTVSNFEQYTLAEFIGGGYFEKHINRMRNYYRGKRDALLNAIAESPLSERVTIHEADAGLHFLMRVNTEIPDSQLIARAAKAGIRISCLSQYYYSRDTEMQCWTNQQKEESVQHIVIVNYSGLEAGNIPDAIHTLCRAWFEV